MIVICKHAELPGPLRVGFDKNFVERARTALDRGHKADRKANSFLLAVLSISCEFATAEKGSQRSLEADCGKMGLRMGSVFFTARQGTNPRPGVRNYARVLTLILRQTCLRQPPLHLCELEINTSSQQVLINSPERTTCTYPQPRWSGIVNI